MAALICIKLRWVIYVNEIACVETWIILIAILTLVTEGTATASAIQTFFYLAYSARMVFIDEKPVSAV